MSALEPPFDRTLARALRRTGVRERARAFALAAPLLLFLLCSFAVPIAALLLRAVYDPTIANALPRTAQALHGWDGTGLPNDDAFKALAADLKQAHGQGTLFNLAKVLNSRLPGSRSHVLHTARTLGREAAPLRDKLIAADPIWTQNQTWAALRLGTHPFTSFYLLNALDLRWKDSGGIGFVPPDQGIYLRVFARTFMVAAIVTLVTLILGFPLAWLAASLPPRVATVILVMILLPFWTSILVRTASWTVLLQKYGLLNDLLLWLGVTGQRIDLMYSRLGMVIAMTHIQLPFTLLPIYSVMRTIQPSQMRAACSLGARPFTAFRRVYLPQVLPGVMAGCLLTFILCLGYFITPALVGGPSDQLISNFISNYVNVELNWQMAAALSFVLLALTLALYAVSARLLGLDRLRLT